MKPVPNHFELPGIPVISLPSQPPVQDSAVLIVCFFSDKKFPRYSNKEYKSVVVSVIYKL